MLGLPEETPMSTDPDPTQSSPNPAAHGRRFKHRELELPDGGKLVLYADGSIAQLGADGTRTQKWSSDDPEWASHAIRFGLFPQDATVPPTGRYVEEIRPPRR
jgi:hypothetical protein